ncbi:MAG: VOC family protein [Hyphomicrobium sp.]|uniref:VOC family protein n=1 Tax=Hyphomicrobium sp. TaxID=82 RepID=UPI003D1083D2
MPTLRYRDVEAAAAWLQDAFGFQLLSIEPDDSNRMIGAQLVLNNGMVILAQVGVTAYDDVMLQPDEIGGAETQSCYIVVADAEAHCAKAKAHGAAIILDLQMLDQGGVGYLCRDLEGHLWSFGTSNPWGADAEVRPPPHRGHTLIASGLLVLAIGAAAVAGWLVARPATGDAASESLAASEPFTSSLVKERAARADAEAEAKRKSDELAKVHREREALVRDAKELEDRASAAAREALNLNEKRSREFDEAVAREREDKRQSERAAAELQTQLDKERAARQEADKGRDAAAEELAQEKAARERAEASLRAALDAQVALERQRDELPTEPLREPAKRASNAPGSTASDAEPMPDFRP